MTVLGNKRKLAQVIRPRAGLAIRMGGLFDFFVHGASSWNYVQCKWLLRIERLWRLIRVLVTCF